MAKFRCMHCNYVHTPKTTESMPKRCPYCGTEGRLAQEETVGDMLNAVK